MKLYRRILMLALATAVAASGGRGGGQPGFGRGGLGVPGRRAEAVTAFRTALEGAGR